MRQKKSVNVHTRLTFPDPLPVSESELATVLANALENAGHACEKVAPCKRRIDVQVLTEPCFMLQIQNTFDGIVVFDEDNIPVSTRQGHGFGTRSIVSFCEKNNAFCEFLAEDKIFYLRIVFRR